jgi:uncharacterized protein (DUF2237 family)
MIAPIKNKGQKNVLGEILEPCCTKLNTGWFRNGSCETEPNDSGRHVICAQMSDEFLSFSQAMGNDLSTPKPEFSFPGLKSGDCWCLCAARWQEAFEAGTPPKVRLASCHESALEIVNLEDLKANQIIED